MARKAMFEEEDDVLAQMSRALDVDVDDLTIEAADNLESFGVSPVWRVEEGRREYYVVEDDDAAEELALAIVKQDLEQEPQLFDQSFIESHIDTDRLRRELRYDVDDMAQEDAEEYARDRDSFWSIASQHDMEVPEEDEDGDLPDPDDGQIEELAEKMAEERLRDPMQYLEDIYEREDAVKKAIEIAGIDVDAAAEEAVRADGFAHFLSSYDGNTYETPGGFVYWRHN